MKVNFIDLSAQYKVIQSEIDEVVHTVLKSGHYIKHKHVAEFEAAFAKKLKQKHCVALGNGTDALLVALKAMGIQQGDEVITPALSWISTAEVISLLGAKPIFADVDPDFFTIDLADAARKVTNKTKALIVVHLYGQVSEPLLLKKFCAENNLLLLEDCAQAHFSSYQQRVAGTIGDVAAFSFYPTKNLGAYGDAGCVVTNSEEMATLARRFSNHGGLTKHEHLLEGINSRMDELQAAILLVKLKYIDEWNERRNKNASLYREQLSEVIQIQLPHIAPEAYHTYHQFVIKAQQREALQLFLKAQKISTEIHYPVALPFEPAYHTLHHTPNHFPVAFKLQSQLLSLPVYPELAEEQITYTCQCIKTFYKT